MKDHLEIKEAWYVRVFNYRTFLMLIITGAMINNLDHSAHLYLKIGTNVSIYQAYSVVIIFDLIVMALIWIGDSKALLFAVSIFLINELAWDGIKVIYELAVRFQHVDREIDQDTSEYLDLATKAITMLIYGGTFAYTVHHFSKLFKAQVMKRSRFNRLIKNLRSRLFQLTDEVNERRKQVKLLEDNRDNWKVKNHDLIQKLSRCEEDLQIKEKLIGERENELSELREFKKKTEQELVCVCGKAFKTYNSKIAHQRTCKVYKASLNGPVPTKEEQLM